MTSAVGRLVIERVYTAQDEDCENTTFAKVFSKLPEVNYTSYPTNAKLENTGLVVMGRLESG